MAVSKRGSRTAEPSFNPAGLIPNHIAIIMDGNGRWAKNRLMPRVYGHKEGMNTVKKVAVHASKLGVKVLTLYAFSTENWKRPNEEVDFLMNLPVDFFSIFMPQIMENNIKVTTMGWLAQLPATTRKVVERAVEETKGNTGMILNFALNYGSRQEMLEAVQAITRQVEQGELAVEAITEETISRQLFTNRFHPHEDPELVIRTSGELRISNFLLWQIAYSELYFTPEYWPDFTAELLEKAIAEYQHRNRRFGGL